MFYDAVEFLQRNSYKSNLTALTVASQNQELDENGEPYERSELPWLKDPNTRIGLWTIIKDSIGKGELSKIAVPVYFNDPTSLL